jgi:hypothetical protein
MAWIGAPGGATWRRRPFRFASGENCLFRTPSIRALDEAGIEWEMAVETTSERTVEATVSADLGVCAMIKGTEPPYLEVIEHGGALPDLGSQNINMYGAQAGKGDVITYLADLLRSGFHPMRGNLEVVTPKRMSAVGR